MLHEKRVFNVAPVASVEELAEMVTERTCTLCAGFELSGLLFLNDSFSEDGAQEYAVVKDGQQVESVTFGWCTRERAEEIIRELLSGELAEDYGEVRARLDRNIEHRCRLCM